MRSLIIILIAFCFANQSFAQKQQDKNLSPYFHVYTEGVEGDHFPLLSTEANVDIVGPVANVEIVQHYKNDGDKAIEAVYVFPMSTQAAVFDMWMKVGEKTIKAEVQQKHIARQNYEKAKSEGKRASLLEQQRANVFQMNVANIMPGDKVEVHISYNEMLRSENQKYTFVYPTVVGPRFVDTSIGEEDHSFANMPYSGEGVAPTYDLDINMNVFTGAPIQQMDCTSHKIKSGELQDGAMWIRLDESEAKAGNRDFIFEYSSSTEDITNATFLFDDGEEKYFLTVMEPPKGFKSKDLAPREYIFVVDVSGSMRGFPINVSKKLLRNLIGQLRPVDKFNVMLFAAGSQLLHPVSVAANQANIAEAIKLIDNQSGGGGTRMHQAIEKAINLPRISKVSSRSVVVVTDGYVSVERATFSMITKNLNNTNVFGFGIGSSVNRSLIEGIASAGRGESFVITEEKYAKPVADRFKKYISTPILTNVKVKYQGFDAYDLIPEVVPDMMSERPVYIIGKYKGLAEGNISLKGYKGLKKYENTIYIKPSSLNIKGASLKYLWAKEKIKQLEAMELATSDRKYVDEITDIGINYNLMTQYTSFVAIEEDLIVNASGKQETVKQVLPMPKGVSNSAIGFSMKLEGVSMASAKKEDEQILFLNIESDLPEAVQSKIENLLKKHIVFSAEEKGFLHANGLALSYDGETNSWTISSDREVSESFKEEFKCLLETLIDGSSNHTLQIKFLWV